MKFKVIYSSLLILLASCTSELSDTPDLTQGQEQEVPVQFSIAINPIENFENRAAINEEYLPGNSMVGVFALKGVIDNDIFNVTEKTGKEYWWHEYNVQENFMNAEYIVTDNKQHHRLIPTGATGSFPRGKEGKIGALQIYAYYPYQENVSIQYYEDSDGKNMPDSPLVDIKIGENINETTDYLYTGPINATANNIITNLTFNHALGKLNVYVYTTLSFANASEEDFPFINNLTITTLKSQEGKMNLATGDILPSVFVNKVFTKDYESPFDDFDNSYLIYENKTSGNLKPIYSNMFIPNVEGQEYLISKLQLTITRRYGEDGKTYTFSQNPKGSEKQIPKIIIEKGKTTNLYINYNPNDN